MIDFNCKFKVYLILMAVFSLHCDRIANGHNIATELESGRKPKREISKRSAGNALPIGVDERKQRFCLNRLRDALQSVCSGSDRIPHYFNPNPNQNQLHVSGNSSNFHFGLERKSRHFRNEISAMAQHNRPLLRRRSRRNIVRECCDKPCSYESMRKYCSASSRQNLLKVTPVSVPDPQSKNGKLSRSIHGYPTVGFSLSDLDYAEASDNNRIGDDSDQVDAPPYPIQCVPVPDLKSYYRKLYQKQSKKDGSTIERIRSGTSNALLDNAEKLTTPSDTLLNTNTVIPDDSSTAPTPNLDFATEFDSKFSQKSSTEGAPTRKHTELEGISQVDEISSLKTRRTSNAMTAKPITRYISLPRGTNDYIY